MNLNRRELKFQIPLSLVEPISQYLEFFAEMDKYSHLAHQGFYTINSLYLDSPSMVLLERKRANQTPRFSVRIRSYGSSPNYPAFLEIKSKADMFIHKRRAVISCADTVEFLKSGVAKPGNPDLAHPVMKAACYHILNLGLAPRLMTQYQRKAYFGRFDMYSRVTFDRRMRCYKESDYNIFPNPQSLINYDHQEQYVEDANVVLEIKCEAKIPFWMTDLIIRFQLRQMQYSKYDSSWTFATDDAFPSDEFQKAGVW